MGSGFQMAATKRAQPATHPTVYVGLALASVGLLLAVYAYTGTRIYDVRFALAAIGGALLAFAGIFTAAWGRAIMAARAQRSRRTLIHDDAVKAAEAVGAQPPTVAAPPEKKRFDFAASARRAFQRREKASREKEPAEVAAAPRGAFAFRRRSTPPPPPAPPEEPAPAPAPVEAPPVEVVPAVTAEPAVERITLKCPRCQTEFTAEGVRPFPIQCPSCGLAGTL